MKKIFALLLAGVMLFALIACNTGDSGETGNTGFEGETGDLNEDPEYANPNLPSQNLGRDVIFLTREEGSYCEEVGIGEDAPDVVYAAIYKRDNYLGRKYGATLKRLAKPKDDLGSYAAEMIKSDDLTFDVIMAGFATTYNLMSNEVLLTVDEIPHVNTEKHYWSQSILESTSIANKNYFLVSPTNLTSYNSASCVFVNTGMYNDLMDSGVYDKDIYEIVRDKEWTVDKMFELSKKAYFDKDGSQSANVGDRFGSCSSLAACEGMFSGMGAKYVTKNEDDIPEYNGITETMSDIMTKIINYWADDSSLLINRYGTEENTVFMDTLTNQNMLFMPEQLYQYTLFGTYGEYTAGVLPMPMYNEEQDTYYTFTHVNWSSATSVPKTLSEEHVDQVGAILEDLAYYSNRDVFPVYYDINLKARRAEGDPDTIEMMDLIFSNLDVDMGNTLVSSQFDAMYILRDLVLNSSTDIVSRFEQKAPIYIAVLQKISKIAET